MQRFLERLAVGAAVGVTALLALDTARRAILPLPMDRCGVRQFDAQRWQDRTRAYSRDAVRGCMVDDLLRRRLLEGRTRDEVVALLGEPRRSVFFGDYDLVYWLGPERSLLSIDSEWLLLRLGADGRVTEIRLATD